MSDTPTDNGAAEGAAPETADTAAPNGAAAAPQQQTQPKMQVLGQYVRDLSFENIVAQKGIQGEVAPDVKVQVNLDAKKRSQDHQYEIILKFTIDSRNKTGQEPLFLMELEYGGIFHVENVPDGQLHPFLMINCPAMLFPFVRRIVSDVTRDGGFPPLNLENVDFLALYRQELIKRAKEKVAEGKAATEIS